MSGYVVRSAASLSLCPSLGAVRLRIDELAREGQLVPLQVFSLVPVDLAGVVGTEGLPGGQP